MKGTWRIHLLVAGGYFLLSILFTWPLLPNFSAALPGEGTDSWQYLWNFWWFDQALLHGRPLYFTRAQYYPQGTSLLFHTLSPLNSFLGLPARFLGGYLAAYNFTVLFSTTLSGYGAFLLALEVLRGVRSRPCADRPACSWEMTLAAFLGGAVFALAPYRSAHLLGHLSLVSTETLPFFALFVWQALRRPGWRPALGIALSWLAALLIDWYYPLYMALTAGFFLLWALGEAALKGRKWGAWARSAATIAGGMAAAALILSPLLGPMFREVGRAAYLEEPLEFSTTYGADLAGFVLPSPQHPWWGPFFLRWTEPFADGNTAEGVVYLGWVALLLGLYGLWQARREGRVWAVLASLSALLALGPYLKVLNQRTAIPLPYLLLHNLPIVAITRVPSRFVILAQLALAVMVGLGAWALLNRTGIKTPPPADRAGTESGAIEPDSAPDPRRQRKPRPHRAGVISAALLALVAVDYLPIPYRMTPATIPPFYQQLAQDQADYAVLELPLQRPNTQWYYTSWMLYQTVHGKDSFRGYISRGDPLFPFAGAPLFRQFARLGPAEDIPSDEDITYDDWRPLARTVLSHYRVGYIVLERERLEKRGRLDQAQALIQEALGPVSPAYEDSEVVAYRVEWGPVTPFLRLGQGWHEVERQPWGPFRWIERDRAEVYVIIPEAQVVDLSFQATSFLRPRRLEVRQNGTPVATLTVGAEIRTYRLHLSMPAGETLLELCAEGYDVPQEAGVGQDPRAISVGLSAIRIR